jgi:oxygen-independent coproporphyrinogen-3 oxidase
MDTCMRSDERHLPAPGGEATMTPQLLILEDRSETTAGGYFVSNYPPYEFWTPERIGAALAALDRAPESGTPLGVYLHIPFCRKRCHFCYFRVYTDKNSREIQEYLDAAAAELALYVQRPFIGGRQPDFIYFGGGTPSYLSVRQLTALVERMKRLLPWDEAEEVTFECEPGTLTEPKLRFLREMGVTRLSLGVEHFEERILRVNGRAHGAKEIDRAYAFARDVGFPQINIDLIAGMMGDTDEGWQTAVEKTLALAPDSVTIYQMEIPRNTTIYREMREQGLEVAPVADWLTKRRWVASAFRQLEEAGYCISSAYTAVKDPERARFVYRDRLWTGADLIGLGVASFSHVGGTHFQNEPHWGPYHQRLSAGELPIYRGLTPTAEERMIRELILQFKRGHVDASYFRRKFGVELTERFAESLAALRGWGVLTETADELRLTREGLLQADRLVHEFFLPQHR